MCFFIFVFVYTTCINNNMILWFSQGFLPSFDFFHDVFSMAKHLFFFYIWLLQRQTVRLFWTALNCGRHLDEADSHANYRIPFWFTPTINRKHGLYDTQTWGVWCFDSFENLLIINHSICSYVYLGFIRHAYGFFQQHFHRLAAGSCHRTTPVGVAISDLGVSASNLRHLEARDDGKILIGRTWRTYTSVIVRFEVSFYFNLP